MLIKRLSFTLCFATVLVTGCGYESPKQLAAKAIMNKLPAIIGPAQRYNVSVAGSAIELSRGHASEVKIHGRGVHFNSDLIFDEVDIDSHNLRFDRSTHRLMHVDDTTATVSIGAANLSNYLHAVHPNWSSLQLYYVNQDIAAQLPLEIHGHTANVRVTGRFLPDPANLAEINLHADSASIAFVPVPIDLVNYALGRLNPIINLRDFRYPVRILSTSVYNNQLVVEGRVQLTQ